MSTHTSKQTVFKGKLVPATTGVIVSKPPMLELCPPSDKPLRYSVLAQSHIDLADPENSPSISMWGYLLASAQTQRLNEISVYAEHGTTAEKIRFLYFNDFGLTIWAEMARPVEVMGRLHRPPRGAVLSFGMPFSE